MHRDSWLSQWPKHRLSNLPDILQYISSPRHNVHRQANLQDMLDPVPGASVEAKTFGWTQNLLRGSWLSPLIFALCTNWFKHAHSWYVQWNVLKIWVVLVCTVFDVCTGTYTVHLCFCVPVYVIVHGSCTLLLKGVPVSTLVSIFVLCTWYIYSGCTCTYLGCYSIRAYNPTFSRLTGKVLVLVGGKVLELGW